MQMRIQREPVKVAGRIKAQRCRALEILRNRLLGRPPDHLRETGISYQRSILDAGDVPLVPT